jgi:hypothetical protein
MFGSTVIDVGIGLVLVYLVLSLACTSLNELLASVFSVRARMLRTGIERLLAQDAAAIQTFYKHPLVKSVAPNGFASYMSGTIFAAAVLDTAIDMSNGAPQAVDEVLRRVQLSPLIGSELKHSLRTLLIDVKDLASAHSALADWFDHAMARVSGTYKRFSQLTVLLVGAFVSAATNADTLSIANMKNGALRAELSASANVAVNSGKVADVSGSLQKLMDVHLLGWNGCECSAGAILLKIIGIVITTLAVSLGAPFWFDMLGRFVRVRSSGARPALAADQAKSASQ